MVHKLGLARVLMLCGVLFIASPGHGLEPIGGLSERDQLLFQLGRVQLGNIWKPAPSDNVAFDGLGPLLSAISCTQCHPSGDAGPSPMSGRELDPVTSRLTITLSPPDPIYGEQIQPFGAEVAGEGVPLLEWNTNEDGLMSYSISITSPGYGAFADSTAFSGRIAPALHGLGLLEAVPEAALLALADPDDRDNDGLSGRVFNTGSAGPVGRFGWQARQPTIASQTMHALSRDMGLSSALFGDPSGDCTSAQIKCRSAPHGAGGVSGPYEVPLSVIEQMVAGVRLSAPPRTERLGGEGADLFEQAGCAGCHIPELPVVSSHFDRSQAAAYTDLLLHDMGDGLAVKTREGVVISREWRTAPLWGLSRRLAHAGSGFLHDGRASTVSEAIRWHQGEGAQAKAIFASFDAAKKEQLIAYVSAL